jgi:glycosyltransferase involved in cell wall biosynthesis
VADVHFVLPQLTPYYGMEKAATLLMTGLQRDGVDVSATVLSGEVPTAASSVPITSLGLPRRLTRLAEAVPALRRLLCSLPAGCRIVASGLWGSAPVGLALIGTGRSYTSWEHSVLPARLALDRRVAALHRLVGAAPVRPAAMIAVSQGVRRTLAERPGAPGDIAVIPNVVVAPERPPEPPTPADGTVSLLTTGAFRAYKNYSCAIEALRHLPPAFHLTMVGDGRQFAALSRRAGELEVADRVAFLGRVDDVGAYLRRSHALVHPSLSETFGFSLVEAADHGLPVAALPVRCVDELVPTYVPGVMAGELTPVALASAISEVAHDGVSRHDITGAWERRRLRFSVSTVCAQWREVLTMPGCASAA